MATRQYIGARYVPKFFENSATGDSTWAANTAYEPLTIVTWNGNSYTSKKAVPAGVGNPSANAEYWASTGMYNAQVEEIREQVQELENDVSHLINDIWIVIWDSYGSDYIANPSAATVLQTISGRSSDELINLVFSGCGFVNSTGGTTFLQGLNAYVNDHPELLTNNVSKIIVAAGRNDYTSSPSVLNTAIQTFISSAKTTFPNASVYLGYIANGKNDSQHGTKAQQMDIYNSFRNCALYGGVYLNGVENILRNNALMASDGIHPNVDGAKAIAQGLYNAIMSGSTEPVYTVANQAITGTDDYTVSNNPNITSYLIGDEVTIINGDFTITKATAISIPATGLRLTIGTLSEDVGTIFYPYGTIQIPVSVTINNAAHYGILRITSNMEIQLHVYPASNLTGVTTMYVRTGTIMYPSVYA